MNYYNDFGRKYYFWIHGSYESIKNKIEMFKYIRCNQNYTIGIR